MASRSAKEVAASSAGVHTLGVVCGLAAGVWLGGAEAPAKLVSAGLSPYAVSLCVMRMHALEAHTVQLTAAYGLFGNHRGRARVQNSGGKTRQGTQEHLWQETNN